jgi:5'-nucleotidase
MAAITVTFVAPANAQKGDNPDQGAEHSREVDLQILAINDFHGNINSSFSTFGGSGGAQYLATHLRDASATTPNSITVSAGDLIGASPWISALFHDEPTIEAANMFGLEINAVGNHEFDKGAAEVLRMQQGGAHPVDGDLDGDPFAGADFQFLSANVVSDDTGDTLLPPYVVKNYQGVRVAFIGMTLKGTPSIVTPSGVAGLTFQDEADTVNALVPELQQQNIEAIVVLIHQGGRRNPSGGEDECYGISGPIVDIVNRTDAAVDLFISGHTHQNYLCEIDGRTVTSARSFGRLYTDIDVKLNRVTKDMTVVSVDNVPVTRDVEPAADLQALIDKYADLLAQ